MRTADQPMRTVRSVPATFKVRDAPDGSSAPVIEAYFAVFDSDYVVGPGMFEQVAPGAFARSLAENDIRALTDHQTHLVLGRTSAGTLTLREDEKGLWGEITINPEDTDAMNLYSRVKRGDVNQCSFGFDIREEEHICSERGTLWRMTDIDLFEVSVVTFPAYEATSAQARSRDYETIQKRRREKWRSDMKEKLKCLKSC